MKLNEVQELRSGLNAYRPEKYLGEGGSGVVFLANDEEANRVAVKILRPGASARVRARFRNELSFGVRNTHTNVVRVLDYGETRVGEVITAFFVMPHYEETLRSAMKGPLPTDEALRIFAAVLDGVECAHLKGIWHRDLKPENILLGERRQQVVVADFGVAHFAEEEMAEAIRTQKQERLANFRYAAPEQREPHAEMDHRVDLFSLGLILNELFTGVTPHGSGFLTISKSAPAWGALDELVDALIRQVPGERPETVAVVKRELARLTGVAAAAQALDAATNQVVDALSAALPEPLTIKELDWENEELVVRFDRPPSPEWQAVFRTGHYPHGELGGIGPEHVRFRPGGATVPATEHRAQQMLNLFKVWVAGANKEHERAETERHRQEALEQERARQARVKEAQKRLKVRAGLRL